MAINHHDRLFKAVFSRPEQMATHLAAILPRALVKRLDLEALRLVSGSFVNPRLSERTRTCSSKPRIWSPARSS